MQKIFFQNFEAQNQAEYFLIIFYPAKKNRKA